MRTPLTVRLDGPNGSLTLTSKVSAFRMKSVAPGGYASVEFQLPRGIDKELLAEFSDVLVFDGLTGEQVGGGRLLDQGRGVGSDGQVWNISALGEGLASMQDSTAPYMLIDSSTEQWLQYYTDNKRLHASAGSRPTVASTNGVEFGVDTGAFTGGDRCSVRHDGPRTCGMELGGFIFKHIEGLTSTNVKVDLRVSYAGGATTSLFTQSWSTALTLANGVVGTHFVAPMDAPTISWTAVTTYTAGDTSWSSIETPAVLTRRMDSTRALTSGAAYLNAWVLGSEAFTDMVARFCPRLSIETARVDISTYQFNQLSWLDGISPLEAMNDVLALEPGFQWNVWNQQADGKWETEFVQLPATIRYEATVADGFDAPTPSTELYNKVIVRGATKSGSTKAASFTQVVPALDDLGIVRAATIDLGDEVWSDTNAAQAGAQFLAEHAVLPNAGTLTVAREIFDNQSRRWVRPYAIRPGSLIRVRGVQPSRDTLNATSPDGTTVFRIVSMTFDDATAAAVLELDTYSLSEERAIADLSKRARKR